MRVPRVLLLLVLFAAPIHSDWLVLKSGERIATKGAWKQRGRSVVYTTMKDGKLVSLPTAEIDLVASLKASSNEPVTVKFYEDLGEAPDANYVAPAPEINKLLEWIQDPNAPRVAGNVSAPALQVSLADLVQEGEQILQDPVGAADALRGEYERVEQQYRDCQKLSVDATQSAACSRAYETGRQVVEDQVVRASVAIYAAQEKAYERRVEDAELDRETAKVEAELEAKDAKAEKKKPRKVTVEVTIPEEDEAAAKAKEAEEAPPPN